MSDSRDLPIQDADGAHPDNGLPASGPDRDRRRNGGRGWPSGPDWRRCLTAVRRYRWLIAIVTVLGTATGAAVAYRTSPEYLAEARLWVESSRQERSGPAPIEPGELLRSYNWVDLVNSYAVLEHVARETGLYLHPAEPETSPLFASFHVEDGFRPGQYRLRVDTTGTAYTLRQGDSLTVQREPAGAAVGGPRGFHWIPPDSALTPGRSIEFELVRPRTAASGLRERLDIRMLENGNFIRLELRGRDPERIGAALDAVTRRTVALARELKNAKAAELERQLAQQLQAAEDRLRTAEADLEAFRERAITLPSAGGDDDGDAASNPLSEKYVQLRMQREQARRDREAIQTALADAGEAGVPVELLEAVPAVGESQELRAALQEITDKRAERRALRERYTDEHPAVRRLDRQLDTLERETIPTLARALADQLSARETMLADELRSAAAELRTVPDRATDEARLLRRVEIAETLYTGLKSRHEEARLAASSSVADIRILDRARAPQDPVSDPRPRILLLAIIGSLGLGIGGSLFADRFDPRMRYPGEISGEMGLSILGVVPRLETRRGGYVAEHAAQGVEAFRSLRLNLTYAFGAAGPLTVAVTSPGPGDGKSFIALNLALTFAEMDRRTLLIDGDIRRGGLHGPLGMDRKPGLTDFLAGNAPLDRVIRSPSYAGLDLVGAGTRMQYGPELLTGQPMQDVLTRSRSGYDVVIVDSPPLGAGADPLILAGLTGHMLLVLRSGTTSRATAEVQLEPLGRLPVRLLGAVLNDVPRTGVYRYYGYGYLPGYEARDEEGDRAGQRLLPT